MTELVVAILVMIAIIGSLAGWAVRADRRRRQEAAFAEKEVVG